MRILKTGLLFATFSGSAWAGGWSDYGKSFPPFPCPDGWTTCEVDGRTVGPGLVTDSSGNPLPANMRFSFWDFESMPSASPFGGLSDYSGDMGARALKADEEDVPVAAVDVEPSIPEIDEGDDIPTLPPPIDPIEPEEPEEPAALPPPPPPPDIPPPPPPPPVVEEPVEEVPEYKPPSYEEIEAAKEKAELEVPPPPPPPPVPPAPPPPPMPDEGKSEVVADAELPPPLPPPPAIEVDCDDIRAIETKAMLGQLGVALRKCLDGRIDTSSKLTDKDKISRVLIADAKARDDKPDWERLMRRHLDTIDRSDPNMCLTYAIFLHKQGVGKSTRVIRWSDYALENKAKWAGATHTRNVYYLHQLKSEAASRLWKRAEKRFVKDRNEKNEAKASKYRSMAKQFSRAWLDYAKASGKETSKPRAACISASGNTEFCPQ